MTCHRSTGLDMKSMAGSVLECGTSRTDRLLLQRLAASSGDEKWSIDASGRLRKSLMRWPPLSGRRDARKLGAPICNVHMSIFKPPSVEHQSGAAHRISCMV